jgi:hypothetical protein
MKTSAGGHTAAKGRERGEFDHLIAEAVGPKAHSILDKTNCSLLILRDGSDL